MLIYLIETAVYLRNNKAFQDFKVVKKHSQNMIV